MTVDVDFLTELLAQPEVEVRDYTRPIRQLDRTVTSVVMHFASVVFNCNYRADGTKCKVNTNYLYLGDPRCLEHVRLEMSTHTDDNIKVMREATSENVTIAQ